MREGTSAAGNGREQISGQSDSRLNGKGPERAWALVCLAERAGAEAEKKKNKLAGG